MGDIHCLDHHTIDQIAAGEVIENPASVLKELLENALDAKATSMVVETEEAGIQKMIVRDNGNGILQQDLPLAILRHATSKISKIEDLFQLRSLGFRGEALASIAAVSKVTIQSLHLNESVASQIQIEGAHLSTVKPASHPKGTTVCVEELFFNVPARKAFLKSSNALRQEIKKVIAQIALTRPDIKLRWIDNHEVKLEFFPQTFEERVKHLFGKEHFSQMIFVNQPVEFGEIKGFISKPHLFKTNRKNQLFLINKRPIQSSHLSALFTQSYGHLLSPKVYPLCCLNMEFDPHLIDMNVHPQKKEVRFREDALIQQGFEAMVKHAFLKKEVKSQIAYAQPLKLEVPEPVKPMVLKTADLPYQQKPCMQRHLLFGKFCIAQFEKEFYLVDLTSAKRALLYQQFEKHRVHTQALMFPLLVELTFLDTQDFCETILEKLGFSLRSVGIKKYAIDAIPSFLSKQQAKDFLFDLNQSKEKTERAMMLKAVKTISQKTYDLQEVDLILKQIHSPDLTSVFGEKIMTLLDEKAWLKLLHSS